MGKERWSLEVHRPVPTATYTTTAVPGGMPLGLGVRWVAELLDDHAWRDGLTYHFGFTRKRAIKKAWRYARKVEKVEASRESVAAVETTEESE